MIPKIVHKTGFYKSENDFPLQLRHTFQHNRTLNPDYQFKYYNDEACEVVIQEVFGPEGLRTYNNLKPGAFRADIFRFSVVYLYGGVYSDLPQLFLKPLRDFITPDDDLVLAQAYNDRVQISFFAASARHPYVRAVNLKQMENVRRRRPPLLGHVFRITGPYVARQVLRGRRFRGLEYRLKCSRTYLSAMARQFKKQALMDVRTQQEVVSFYNGISRQQRSSNHYYHLFFCGDVYVDRRYWFSPVVQILLLGVLGLLVFVVVAWTGRRIKKNTVRNGCSRRYFDR